MNPISVGGYTWVVFVSPRDYGNKTQSQASPTYENRKQLWVAAVDASPKAGKDPSHPAFWLPAQDLTTVNTSGYRALEPCKQLGNACEQGFECCVGSCEQGTNGTATCSPPPMGCAATRDKCATSSDCCGNPTITCVGGFCAPTAPT